MIDRERELISRIVWPMSTFKFIKCSVLGAIWVTGFYAWGQYLSTATGLQVMGGLAFPIFAATQYIEARPDLMLLGSEHPKDNARKLQAAAKSPELANASERDLRQEFSISAQDVAIARIWQAMAFFFDFWMSFDSFRPFTSNLASVILYPAGLLDFRITGIFMLLIVVFGTPRLIVSAANDDRFKSMPSKAKSKGAQ